MVSYERETRLIDEFRKRRLQNLFNELAGMINPFRDKPRTLKEAQELSEEEEEEFLQQLKNRRPDANNHNPVLDELLKMLLELKRINTLQKCFKVFKRVRMGSAKTRAKLGEEKVGGGYSGRGYSRGLGIGKKSLVGAGAAKSYRGNNHKTAFNRL